MWVLWSLSNGGHTTKPEGVEDSTACRTIRSRVPEMGVDVDKRVSIALIIVAIDTVTAGADSSVISIDFTIIRAKQENKLL